ncbi:cupin domain-containing protein [Providencia vermicola]|uniref:cupin domain-containing protein n=1 Tax=Providencia vermicola TaxID=333965 RepID=UPI001CED4D85|nr:cupin domain-containing protein [Providencia vermicola]USR64452.1 cupin domain-containing protein [Providencia stuartii]
MFIFDNDIEAKNIAPGTLRKIFLGSENMMMVKVSLITGTMGELHEHQHEQMSYILSGKFKFRIGEREKIVSSGDVVYVPSNEKHQSECLISGEILDVFVPMRKDFLI